jgi:hypothetical protein
MAESDHEQIADRLSEESDALERHAHELEDKIDRTKQDWERKRSDPAVPGADPPKEPAGEEEPSEQQTPPS